VLNVGLKNMLYASEKERLLLSWRRRVGCSGMRYMQRLVRGDGEVWSYDKLRSRSL